MEAFKTFGSADLSLRRQKLEKLASIIAASTEKFAQIITKEVGKPLRDSRGEVLFGISVIRYYVENSEKFLQTQVKNLEAKKCLVEYHPVGPIYFIVPFNVPFVLSIVGAVPNLMLGNTLLYRTADTTPLMGKALEEAMIEAGLDNGEFQLVFTTPDQTELIMAHKHTRGVYFTGSTKAGQNIASIAGKYAKKAVMELGGSDPFIVLRDADLEKAVQTAIESRLDNCGQICCAGKRFIIDESIYETFKEKLIKKVSEIKIGDPMNPETQLGPLARSDLLANIERQVEEAAKQGAKMLLGGKRPENPELKNGNFYLPTIFEVEDRDSLLFREETFGPVFALMKVSSEDEMVKIANDTEYGLGCSIFSEDIERAQVIGKKIESGMIVLNGKVHGDLHEPFGGVKGSGFGRELAEHGLHEFANIKAIRIHKK